MRATVITDASFAEHKGGIYTGWAAWVRLDRLPYPVKRSGVLRPEPFPLRNSTHAELYAAINGVAIAHRHGASLVLLQTDCMGVVGVVDGSSREDSPLAVLWRDAMDHAGLSGGAGGPRVKARHVKGHTNKLDSRSYVNRWCDAEAKKHMRKARGF